MFQMIIVEKIKTYILCSTAFVRKSCRLWDNVKKYGRAGEATHDNVIRRMRFARWITKATDTDSEYVILIAFSQQKWLRERAWCYIICKMPVLFRMTTAVWLHVKSPIMSTKPCQIPAALCYSSRLWLRFPHIYLPLPCLKLSQRSLQW